jgi:hypothetical protein
VRAGNERLSLISAFNDGQRGGKLIAVIVSKTFG